MHDRKELYENIRKYRIEKGLSQNELAEMTGYASNSMIAQIESGIIDLPYSKVILFADALGVSIPTLMGYPDQKKIRAAFESLPLSWQNYMYQQLQFARINADEEKKNGGLLFSKYKIIRTSEGNDPVEINSAKK